MTTQQVETLPPTVQYIGIPKRLVASVVDGLIASLLTFIAFWGYSEFESSTKTIAYLVLLTLIQWAYFALVESSPQQATLGKMALGVIVVNAQGKKISFGQANLRYLGKLIWTIIIFIALVIYSVNPVAPGGDTSPNLIIALLLMFVAILGGGFSYLMPAFNLQRQALHDRIARTFVIDAEAEAKRLPQKALLQILAVALVSGTLFHFVPSGEISMGDGTPPAEISPSPIISSSDSESSKLVGAWQAEAVEQGVKTKILWYVKSDGTTEYQFTNTNGVTKGSGTWRYSDQTIFETYSNGSSGKGSIRWISDDHIELTILNNGDSAYTGLKRNYYRLTTPSTESSPQRLVVPNDDSGNGSININLCGVKESAFSPSETSYLNGIWEIQFSAAGKLHNSTLLMKDKFGVMKTEFYNADSQKTETVLQTMQLRQSPTGLWILGYDPIDSKTKQPASYSADNIYRQQRPDGSILTFNCDDQGNLSPASMKFIREQT